MLTLASTMPSPLYPVYGERFGFSDLVVTLIYATYAVGVITALLAVGRLSDEIGRRRALFFGLVLSAASTAVFLLAHGIAPLFLGRFLSGLSIGVFAGTATATLVDLAGSGHESRATLASTFANLGGLALGPLIAGALMTWEPLPLRLTFWFALALLVPAALCVWTMPETVAARGRFRLRPQALSVPAEMRAIFGRASLVGFVGFAVLGSFTGVASAFLPEVLGVTSHFVAGLVVFLVFGSSVVGQLLIRGLDAGPAMRRGCGMLLLGLALDFAGLADRSLALLLAGGMICGLGQGLGFRAALFTINAAAPAGRRAEVASSFFVISYVGLSIPAIGIGVLADLADLQLAGLVFAVVSAVVTAIAIGLLAPGSRVQYLLRKSND